MPHIKSKVDLEKSFGKFSANMLPESKRLEMAIEKDRKIINCLFIALFSALALLAGLYIYSLYLTGIV